MRRTVITQVFPDEFHLNTLDQLLGAIAQLNPHVNMKAIVIGLMDRLSAYAARDSESDSPKDREKSEEEATAKLLEKLRISKETKAQETKANGVQSDQPNGNQVNGDKHEDPGETTKSSEEEGDKSSGPEDGETPLPSQSGIPDDVKLYEIFYDQVTHLVNVQRLHIQDTIALLVSLSNLAL